MTKTLFLAILVVTMFLVFVLSSSSSQLPEPNLANYNANQYLITRQDDVYWLKPKQSNLNVQIPVGNSNVDLSPYIGKEVKLTAYFPQSTDDYPSFSRTQQCILGQCRWIFPNSHAEAITIDVEAVQTF